MLEAFARRAFRRPPTAEDLDRLLALFDRAQARGDSYVASLRLALQGVFVSPHFLFLVEPEPADEGVYALACTTAGFAAVVFPVVVDAGRRTAHARRIGQDCSKTKCSASRSRRMLADPRSQRWPRTSPRSGSASARSARPSRPDGGRFPEFDDELAAAMQGRGGCTGRPPCSARIAACWI